MLHALASLRCCYFTGADYDDGDDDKDHDDDDDDDDYANTYTVEHF